MVLNIFRMLMSPFYVPGYWTALCAQSGIDDPSEITPTMTATEVGSFVLYHVRDSFIYVCVESELGSYVCDLFSIHQNDSFAY